MNTMDAFSIRHRCISPGLIVSVGWYRPLTSVDCADSELTGGSTIAPLLISTPLLKTITRSPLGGTRETGLGLPYYVACRGVQRPDAGRG